MKKNIIKLIIVVFISHLGPSLICQKTHADNISYIQKKIEKYERKNKFHGGVLIANKDEILLEEAFGNSTNQVKNKRSSSFGLASIGKMYTGVICAHLVQIGKLNYYDKIVKYLPEFENNSQWKQINISHLLTHSSGIPDIYNYEFIQKTINKLGLTDEEYFNHYRDNKYSFSHFQNELLEFIPGSKFKYSNSGYLLLGLIIEKIVKEEYSLFAKRYFIANTNLNTMELTTSYGGGQTNLRDLLTFAQYFDSLKYSDASVYTNLTSGKINIGKKKGHQWSYGCEILEFNGTKIITHKGGGAESKAQVLIFPESQYYVIIYSNNNQNGYKEFLRMIRIIKRRLSKLE